MIFFFVYTYLVLMYYLSDSQEPIYILSWGVKHSLIHSFILFIEELRSVGICLQLLIRHSHLNLYKDINKMLAYRMVSMIYYFFQTFMKF